MTKKRGFPNQTGSGTGSHGWRAAIGGLLVAVGMAVAPGTAVAQEPAPAEPAPAEPAAGEDEKRPEPAPETPALPPAEEVELETSDGTVLTVWHYPGNGATPAGAGVSIILLHDFGSSHKGVEPLAKSLQALGFDVVAPDLRGHGASRKRRSGDREIKIDAKLLKPGEIEHIAHSRGGQVRDQALNRGDVETTRNWMKDHGLPLDRLYVAGVGLGAGLAAAWTADDASWPSLASGPQGKQVRGLVLITPPMASRGFTMAKPLEQDSVRRTMPILILGGRNDKDADRVFDQLKRQRPQSWYKSPAKGDAEQADKLDDPTKATLFQIEFDSTLEGEKLAVEKTVAEKIERFFSLTKPTQKPRR